MTKILAFKMQCEVVLDVGMKIAGKIIGILIFKALRDLKAFKIAEGCRKI